MGGDGEAALRVNQVDRLGGREMRRDAFVKVEPDQVAVQRADLFAHDHLDPELRVVTGEASRLERALDLVVVRDREDVELSCRGADEDVGALSAVAPGRMDVQVGAAGGEGGTPPLPWYAPRSKPGHEVAGRRGMHGHLRPACPT